MRSLRRRSSRTSATICAYRASRSALYDAISPFASSTAARNLDVFSASRRASSALPRQSLEPSAIAHESRACASVSNVSPSLAARTIACASFSASINFEMPSRDASMAHVVALDGRLPVRGRRGVCIAPKPFAWRVAP